MRRQLSCYVGLCGVHLLDALRPTDSKLSDSCDSRYCENAEQREDAFNQAASELEGSWQ